jgi:hypothetical protein
MWQLTPNIRGMVKYRQVNLMSDFSHLGMFDLIFCRNVLIYFDQQTKVDLLDRLAQVTAADGYLVLGAAETVVGLTDSFTTVPDTLKIAGTFLIRACRCDGPPPANLACASSPQAAGAGHDEVAAGSAGAGTLMPSARMRSESSACARPGAPCQSRVARRLRATKTRPLGGVFEKLGAEDAAPAVAPGSWPRPRSARAASPRPQTVSTVLAVPTRWRASCAACR